MIDYPKLRTPVMALVFAALFVAVSWKAKEMPDWVRLFTALLAVIFAATGLVTLADWIAHNTAERLQEINTARTWGAVSLAGALKGLTQAQTEAVFAGEKVAMSMIPGDEEPILYVRGLTRAIPWDFVEEFLQRSQMTEPFLFPIREAGNEEMATDLTNLIVSRGWADKAVGPFSAKLTKPLEWVARRFWVSLETPEAEGVLDDDQS